MTAPRQFAEAFSGHRFRDAYAILAPDVRWTSVGEGVVTGRQAVVDVCEATLAELSSGTAQFLRFLVIADGDRVAVDAVGRYVDAEGGVSVVSSCDIYEFRDGALTSITSYAVELDPTRETTRETQT
jgi:ketosteroid isomerase-like protein